MQIVILSVLMCDIWIKVLLQSSALVGPLHIFDVGEIVSLGLAIK
jgi:hypothetical protein